MGSCLGFHQIGTFFLFVSLIFLIVATISAPVVSSISLLTVKLTNSTEVGNSSITLGTFGYCVLDAAGSTASKSITYCSPVAVGYNVSEIVSLADTSKLWNSNSLDLLTKGLVLHPTSAAFVFISFLIAGCSHRFGYITAAFFSGLAWALALAALIVDVVLFGIVKAHVNADGSGASASFGTALWLVVASVIVLFLGAVTTLFSCITDRKPQQY